MLRAARVSIDASLRMDGRSLSITHRTLRYTHADRSKVARSLTAPTTTVKKINETQFRSISSFSKRIEGRQ
jgi:hypothetical protein